MPNAQDNSQYADTGWNDDDASAGGGSSSNNWSKKASKGLGAVAGILGGAAGAKATPNRYQNGSLNKATGYNDMNPHNQPKPWFANGIQGQGSPNPMPNSTGAQAGGMLGSIGNAVNQYRAGQQINNSQQGGMPPMQPAGGQTPFSAPPVNNMLPPNAPSPIMAQGGTVNGLQGNGMNNFGAQPYNAPKPYGGQFGPTESQPPVPARNSYAQPMATGGQVGGPTDSLTGAPTGAFGGMASAGAQYNPGGTSTPLASSQPQGGMPQSQAAIPQQNQGGGMQQGGWQMGGGRGGPMGPQGPQGGMQQGGGQAAPTAQFGQGGQNRWGGGAQISNQAPAQPMQPQQRPPMGGGIQQQQQQSQPIQPRYQSMNMRPAETQNPYQGITPGQASSMQGPMAPPQGNASGQAAMARGGVVDPYSQPQPAPAQHNQAYWDKDKLRQQQLDTEMSKHAPYTNAPEPGASKPVVNTSPAPGPRGPTPVKAKGGVVDGGIPGIEPPKAEAAMRRYSPIGPRNPSAMFSPSPTDEAHRLPNRISLTPKINVKMPHPKKFGVGPK